MGLEDRIRPAAGGVTRAIAPRNYFHRHEPRLPSFDFPLKEQL